MRKFIVEKVMANKTDGHYIVREDKDDPLRMKIMTKLQFFTTQKGYDFAHPEEKARSYAEAICEALNGPKFLEGHHPIYQDMSKLEMFHVIRSMSMLLKEKGQRWENYAARELEILKANGITKGLPV